MSPGLMGREGWAAAAAAKQRQHRMTPVIVLIVGESHRFVSSPCAAPPCDVFGGVTSNPLCYINFFACSIGMRMTPFCRRIHP